MNPCAHKGAKLVSAPNGNTGKFFRCPYHGWAYKHGRSDPLYSAQERLRRPAHDGMRGGQSPGASPPSKSTLGSPSYGYPNEAPLCLVSVISLVPHLFIGSVALNCALRIR